MAIFVLVHGAWHGSWCWKRVRPLLESTGHQVFTPTLTGVGERSHLLAADVDLETHALDVANLIRWEELEDVVLVGHSYGGAVIGAAAELVAERLGALVYLDAFVLQDGQSVHDVLPPEAAAAQAEAAHRMGDGWRVPPIPAEAFNVNAADRAWVDAQCTPMPIACFTRRLPMAGAAAAVPSTYVLATDYPASPFAPFAALARARGWRTRDLPCGHDVMLDMPEDVAGLLVEAAGRSGTAASAAPRTAAPAACA